MKAEIQASLIRTISSIQTASGLGGDVTGSTRPLNDLQGFDSYSAVETISTICSELGFELKDDFKLFRTDDKKEARTIDEIVEVICQLTNVEEGRKHG